MWFFEKLLIFTFSFVEARESGKIGEKMCTDYGECALSNSAIKNWLVGISSSNFEVESTLRTTQKQFEKS